MRLFHDAKELLSESLRRVLVQVHVFDALQGGYGHLPGRDARFNALPNDATTETEAHLGAKGRIRNYVDVGDKGQVEIVGHHERGAQAHAHAIPRYLEPSIYKTEEKRGIRRSQ